MKRHVFVTTVFACLVATSAAGQECGTSRLDPSRYTDVDSHSDLRELVVEDLAKYRSPDDVLSMFCFAQHYSEMGDDRPFGTNASIELGSDSSDERLYYFDILVWTDPPETEGRTSVGYWVKLSPMDGRLVIVDDSGQAVETVFEAVTIDPRTCGASPFEAARFTNIRSRREVGRLIEEAIREEISANGKIDWLCFAQAFMEMDEHLPERIWADLILEGPDQRGVYRFTIRNISLLDILTPAPGGSNGQFTAIVRVESDSRIAIVEPGADYRWLEFE